MDNLGAGKQIDYLLKLCNLQLCFTSQIKKQGLANEYLLL